MPVGSRSLEGVGEAVQIVMCPWPLGWATWELLEGSGADQGLGRVPLAALENRLRGGGTEAGPGTLAVIQA